MKKGILSQSNVSIKSIPYFNKILILCPIYYQKTCISLFFLILFILGSIVSCSESKNDSAATTSLFSLLANESGSDGKCTVTGLGSQFSAGFISANVASQNVLFLESGSTSYAVVQVKGANTNTILTLSKTLNVSIFKSSSCPLNVDTDLTAVSGTDYLLDSSSETKITFLTKTDYLIYIYSINHDAASVITAIVSGTELSVEDRGISGYSFNNSCNNASANYCTDLYGSQTSCLSGETSAGTKCSTSDILGVCRQPKSLGYRFTLYNNSFSGGSTGAQAACLAVSGTYSSGYTAP